MLITFDAAAASVDKQASASPAVPAASDAGKLSAPASANSASSSSNKRERGSAGAESEKAGAAKAEPAKAAAASSTGAKSAEAQPATAVQAAAAGKPAAAGQKKAVRAPEPPPTEQQARLFLEAEREMKQFERAASEYRKILGTIVKHHYEERRRRAVAHLDERIAAETTRLAAARAEAIRRLEIFVAEYDGPNAHPEATPDAMYRLASLYEERARSDFNAELSGGLKPAVALYRRIVQEFPRYKEIAGVHYYFGHALMDSGELEQAQQVWRSLVCSNNYTVRGDAVDSTKVLVQPLSQDHPDAYWTDWYNRNPIPIDQLPPERQTDKRDRSRAERSFVDPYGQCQALPQELKEGEEPRYVAEVWWQLGNFHFDQLDTAGGPFALNRAASAFEKSMTYKKPPLYGVAMYKRAWTYFKEQRYRAAVEWFVNLLHYADEQEEKTGDPGADFRSEAYTYIAGSLTYLDFDGPRSTDPFIPRSDVLDLESDPLVAEDKMAVAIARVQDPALIPQDRKWTVEVYKALGREYAEISQRRNAIRTIELTLRRFPLDRDAPLMQNQVAEAYDEMARSAADGSAVKEEATNAALAARTALANYVGDTDWTRANKDDPEALLQAEQLVHTGLQRAAADHTNYARAYVARARQVSSQEQQIQLIRRAIEEYRLAAQGWAGYIEQDPNSIDAYDSRFWLADARYWDVVLQVQLGESPDPARVDAAVASCARVRDSNEDDKYLQPAAYYLVVLADKVVEAKNREFDQSGGTRGIAKRDEVGFSGEGASRKVESVPLPPELVASVTARDEYVHRVDPSEDPQKNGPLYSFQAADQFFVYGQFREAENRFGAIMQANCGKNEWGYKAWEKLISMSNFGGDAKRSRELVEGVSCAFDADSRAAEDAIRTPVKQGVAYLDARKVYDEAEGMPPGPARDTKWRQAAAAYKVALDAAPERDEAPEAAMNGAYAYKQVGEYDKAIEMYELFIARYGNEKKLAQLKSGDPKAKLAADPEKYESRVRFLKMAYDALGNAYVLFFNYPKAAETFDKIGANQHFAVEQRRAAAQQAMNLYASLGDARGMTQAHGAFTKLGASRKEVAEADYVVASSTLKQWDQFSADTGANGNARKRAEIAMKNYFDANKANPDAYAFDVEAAYWVAKLKIASKSGQEKAWWQSTIDAFDAYKKLAPKDADGTSSAVGSRQANFAAEAAFVLVDQEVKAKFDYDTGHHRFRGTPQEVLVSYRESAKQAKEWYDKLQVTIDNYGSPEWGTATVARQGSLYDSLRSGIYNLRPPELQMFDKKTEAVLKRAEESDNPDLQEKADALRVKVESAWQEQRDRELEGADQVMIDRYGRAVTMARKYNVSNPAVVRAIQRLAFYTDVIGEGKLKKYTERVPELQYAPGLFLRIRPGVVTAPDAYGLPRPAPAVGATP